MESENQINSNNDLLAWFAFLAMLLTIQGSLLWIDHHPMFFLGDSGSYLWTSISGSPPTDRSFIYGYFIHIVAVSTQSLLSLVMVQVFLMCMAVTVMAHLLIRYFGVRPWIAFTVALLTSLEPLQLLYGRYVMTETLAMAVFVFYVWMVIHYLEDPQIKWLVIIQVIATLMISIRFALIPMVWICAPAIPILACSSMTFKARLAGVKTGREIAWHVVISILLLFLFTTAYKHIHGYLQHKPPAYSYDSGFFAMGFILPILEPNDFPDEAMGHKVLNDLRFSLTDRSARAANRWMEGGAVDRLQKIEPDRMKANTIASHTVIRAVVRKPLAFLQLGGNTFRDYFKKPYLQQAIEGDLGSVRLDDGFYNLIKTRFHYLGDQSSALDLKTPTGRYFLLSGYWFQILLFLPIGWGFLFVVLRDRVQRHITLLLGLISVILIGVSIFLVERPTPRFLHIVAYLFFFAAGVGLNRLFSPCVNRYA